MQQTQKNMKLRKNIKSQTYKKYIIPRGKKVS